jgi:hypothetical protein
MLLSNVFFIVELERWIMIRDYDCWLHTHESIYALVLVRSAHWYQETALRMWLELKACGLMSNTPAEHQKVVLAKMQWCDAGGFIILQKQDSLVQGLQMTSTFLITLMTMCRWADILNILWQNLLWVLFWKDLCSKNCHWLQVSFSINGDADWQDHEAGQFDFHSRWQCYLYRL